MKPIVQYLVYLAIIHCIMPFSATSRTFPVNSTEDVNDLNPGDGLCVAYLIVFPPFVLPFCTLRAAIEETTDYTDLHRSGLEMSTRAVDCLSMCTID